MTRKYWYLYVYEFCPVCGRDESYKIRQYTEKPEEYDKRHVTEQVYDWCDS